MGNALSPGLQKVVPCSLAPHRSVRAADFYRAPFALAGIEIIVTDHRTPPPPAPSPPSPSPSPPLPPLPPGDGSSGGVASEQCSHTENRWLVAEETFLLGLLWGCFVTALVLKRKAIKQVCCDAGAKITSTHEPYMSHLETDDHDARTQAAIEDSINHAGDLPPSPPPAQDNGAGPSSFGDIELAEVKPTRREL